eukprot:766304-Hanusia_phi.AAC.2
MVEGMRGAVIRWIIRKSNAISYNTGLLLWTSSSINSMLGPLALFLSFLAPIALQSCSAPVSPLVSASPPPSPLLSACCLIIYDRSSIPCRQQHSSKIYTRNTEQAPASLHEGSSLLMFRGMCSS